MEEEAEEERGGYCYRTRRHRTPRLHRCHPRQARSGRTAALAPRALSQGWGWGLVQGWAR